MTNGEVFQKIFPCEEIHINGLQDGIVHFSMTSNLKSMDCFSLEWWNAEYNGSFAVPERENIEKIKAEIEKKCDRINSIASILSYPHHREIQELLCEILASIGKAEREE